MSDDANKSPQPQAGHDDFSFDVPEQSPVLSLDHMVLFPSMIAPIIIGDERGKRLVEDSLRGNRIVAVFTRNPATPEEATGEDRIYRTGTATVILKMLRMPDSTIRLLIHGLRRVRFVETISTDPYLIAKIQTVEEPPASDKQTQAMVRNAQSLMRRTVELSSLPEDLAVAVMNVSDAGRLADLIASNLSLQLPEQQEILELADPKARLERILVIINREIEVLELGSEIQSQVKTSIDRSQREYYLREQLKAIRKELGEGEEGGMEISELRRQIEKTPMPEHARKIAEKELTRLESMPPSSAEYTVSRTYVDWILSLPWEVATQDTLDIAKAQHILDEDHYNLEKVKERILEYLAVIKLRKQIRGPILCFVGAPGVGKTSLGRSIARAMGRKFYRTSLGGMHDEAEIRGHRRTYIGAMPGRIIKGIKDCGSRNPVMMLDEVDKLGHDFRGDPASALLEVLDPEQNNSFVDNYLDMPFDLSKVMFITTANILDTIPSPLRDRMEVIMLSGYTPNEKTHIARRYLIPRQMENAGLHADGIHFTPKAVMRIIGEYTREAGLRNLEREIGNICRKVARKRAAGETRAVTITPKRVAEMLGPPRFFQEVVERVQKPGVAVGLAWTEAGGEILFIECSRTGGSGRFLLTGQLGDVMKESAQAALTYLHSCARQLNIPERVFARSDFHIHVPAAAIPKDGPSAGTAICAAIASLLGGSALRERVAMTGELTLKGNVLPVGGIKEKVLAAHRAGVHEIVLPRRNEKDLDEIPVEIRSQVRFHLVDHMDEVLDIVFPDVGEKETPEETAPRQPARHKPGPPVVTPTRRPSRSAVAAQKALKKK
jgi:ATP-dependent Lon protease